MCSFYHVLKKKTISIFVISQIRHGISPQLFQVKEEKKNSLEVTFF